MSKRILWWIGALVFWGVVILINANSAQWVFLARVQWSALLALTILPVLAHTFGRELLIGGYDLNNRLAGLHVGLLLVLVATSIVDTAYIIQEYGQERLREALGHLFFPSWGWMLLVLFMIAINAGTAFAATDPEIRGQMVYGLISGFLLGVGAWLFLDFVLAREIPLLLDKAGTVSPLIQEILDWGKATISELAGILPPWLRSGYFRVDGNVWVIEPGHIRAAVCFLATTLLYFWLKTKQLTPLCYVLLLITVLVLGPFRALIFPRCFSDPAFCSDRFLAIRGSISPESRSFLSHP
jgi:hypothetical protein